MKKLLVIMVVLLFALSLFAACGSKNAAEKDDIVSMKTVDDDSLAEDEDDEDYVPETMDWPAADLPDGFPEYPDGNLTYVDVDDTGVYVFIEDTEKETYDAYLKTLESDGWKIDEELAGEGDEGVTITKGAWLMSLSFDEGTFTMLASEMEFEFGESGFSTEWPENMPFDLPEYTDGAIEAASYDDDDGLFVIITDTSKAACDKYKDELSKAGWEIKTEGGYTYAEKDEWHFNLDDRKIDEGELILSVMNLS